MTFARVPLGVASAVTGRIWAIPDLSVISYTPSKKELFRLNCKALGCGAETRDYSLTVVACVIIAARSSVAAQVVDSTILRRTDVVVTIANDHPSYDGTYRASGTSRICGKLDLMMPHRANSFNVSFPDAEPNLAVPSVDFAADALPAGATTNSFYLSVGIRTPKR